MDPTYDQKVINKNPVWKRAFYLSEMMNAMAPLGWSKYIPQAEKDLKVTKQPTKRGVKS
jgi:hypothetical protein